MESIKNFTILPLEIEVPSNIRDFNLGLMFRESLDFNKGMLFVFNETKEQSFYMKETKIPLDIAFIREDGIIESIRELKPFDETPISSEGEIRYALEVNREWFTENEVRVGDEINIDVLEEGGVVIKHCKTEWSIMSEATTLPTKRGNIIITYLSWKAKNFVLQMFFPQATKPSRKDVVDQLQKVYPGAKLWNYQVSNYNPGEPLIQVGEN